MQLDIDTNIMFPSGLYQVRGSLNLSPAPFNPADHGTLALWLKADALALTDGDPVSTWADSSGSGNNATQATSDSRATFKAAILNALPVVRFDGIDDFMGAPSITTGSVFVVANYTKATPFNDYDGILTCLDAEVVIGEVGSTNFYASIARTTHSRFVNGTATESFAPLATAKCVSTLLDTPQSGVITIGRQYLHTERCWGGDIAEIIVFADTLNTANRQAVETYLLSKYGLS